MCLLPDTVAQLLDWQIARVRSLENPRSKGGAGNKQAKRLGAGERGFGLGMGNGAEIRWPVVSSLRSRGEPGRAKRGQGEQGGGGEASRLPTTCVLCDDRIHGDKAEEPRRIRCTVTKHPS
ncbi:hypothetical protein GQ53DRAFT_741365 [Thozetella sp. PMI_491]|nr:hypothetical protein GQ53DRAFT_741365 [Thozetella sp. PMI_491]